MSIKILAIETATEACSAALVIHSQDAQHRAEKQQNNQIISRFELAPREHTKLILPMLDEVLDEANLSLQEIDAIAFGRGPGAFTGLRIAAGVAQGLALSVNKPVIPVSTLAALALQATEHQQYQKNQQNSESEQEIILVTLDARMEEVYWGCFENHQLKGEERVTPASQMLDCLAQHSDNTKKPIVIGNGWDVYADQLNLKNTEEPEFSHIPNALPEAKHIALLALELYQQQKWLDAADAQPVYIRDNVALTTAERNRT